MALFECLKLVWIFLNLDWYKVNLYMVDDYFWLVWAIGVFIKAMAYN